MDKRELKPEQIVVPGEYQLGNDAILQTYFGIYNNGGGEYIAPVLIARNNPEVIRKTIEGKVRGEIDKMKSPIEDHQKIDGLIGISMSPDDRPMGLPFGEMLMKNFGFSGEWDEFKEKYDQGFFHPMYINPSVCRLVGEEDIVETCEKDNFRLTYGNEVLTKQQHEKMKQEFGGKLRAESDRLFKMKYSP